MHSISDAGGAGNIEEFCANENALQCSCKRICRFAHGSRKSGPFRFFINKVSRHRGDMEAYMTGDTLISDKRAPPHRAWVLPALPSLFFKVVFHVCLSFKFFKFKPPPLCSDRDIPSCVLCCFSGIVFNLLVVVVSFQSSSYVGRICNR